MSTHTLDSGAYPAHGIRGDRKTPAPWDISGPIPLPSESMLGRRLRAGPGRPPTGSMRAARAIDPWADADAPSTVVTARATVTFMAGLAVMTVLQVFVF